MITHDTLWAAIDELAEENGLSPSGLAVAAGLDNTSFNPVKRFSPSGKPRWPSVKTVLKILVVTNTTWGEFGQIMDAMCTHDDVAHKDK